MSAFSNPLPGVPCVESPFFEAIFGDASPAIGAIARALHDDGFAVIDFPEPDFGRICAALIGDLKDRFDWDRWHRSGFEAGEGLQIQDAWRFCESAGKIAANQGILDLLSALYGRRPRPFQTLNFPVGTQQHFHTDSVHFSSVPERFMCGVWVALEDVHEDAGPLMYYPGTHKWPIYTNEHIGVCVAESAIPVDQGLYENAWRALVANAGIEPERFLARKGQALIWAANLLHGGAPQKRADLTRWSQVTHYYFDDCAYYTPMRSDPFYGSIWFREQADIATGETVPNRYLGHLVPETFIRDTHPHARRLPPRFDAELYYQANPDVRAAGVDAGDHWLRYGRFENRALAPLAADEGPA